MHLKSLTLRGFKSFAAATTLRFEPGITCVVGANGSGKSNVVDALAWVLGEQGAKSLRGGKMEDVVFAGTPGRPPLGRAEVVLTIDNSDAQLPIEFAEVSIGRTLFRNGGSEYAINGSPCRLLDVQELLSDVGIGREMHVIVGQGQLDAVLSAGPEERRAFIEEAAGALKHRRRKEKALRKLEAMQANLTRLQDLTAELRRQLKPLGKQAETARRAAAIQAQLREARLRLAADELVTLRRACDEERCDDDAVRARREVLEAALAEARHRRATLEQAAAREAARAGTAQETWYRLAALAERLRGTATLAAQRHALLERPVDEGRRVRDPAALEHEAAQARAQHTELAERLDRERAALTAAEQARRATEARAQRADAEYAAATRAASDRRFGLERLRGEAAAVRSRVAGAEEESARLATAGTDAEARVARGRAELAALESEIGRLGQREIDLDGAYEQAVDSLAAADRRVAALRREEQEAEHAWSVLAARVEALELTSAGRNGAGALLASDERSEGVLDTVAALLAVAPGAEAAIAAALGVASEAVAVKDLQAAVRALDVLKAGEAGRCGLLVAGPGAGDDPTGRGTGAQAPQLPGEAVWASELVRAAEPLGGAIARALTGVAVVADLTAARRLVEALPALRAVTRDGDLLGAGWAAGGSPGSPSALEVHSALEEARAGLAAATATAEQARVDGDAAQDERARLAGLADAALARLHESDARFAAAAEQLGSLRAEVRAAAAEADRLRQAREQGRRARDRDLAALAALDSRLAAAQAASTLDEPDSGGRDVAAAAAAAARSDELDARLAVRTSEEQVRAVRARAESLEAAARDEREARQRSAALRRRREREARVACAVAGAAATVSSRIEESLAAAAAERAAAERERARGAAELAAVHARLHDLGQQLGALTDDLHRREIVRAEQRLRIEQLEARLLAEHGGDAQALVDEYGPGPAPDGQAEPFDRAAVRAAAATAERALAQLGKVNPLALEEFAALEERHAFLQAQLEDLRRGRADLLGIVAEVDERVRRMFEAAFADTAREFERVFAALFPGGEGRLVLTEADDLLATGVEVQARPGGKRVRRLSLLSGGERSLAAIALLVAIFRARPSPFYVLDEVEAALDDRNLTRLLALLEELSASSQLVVVTHQKRTMEVADALYGVTMRGGVSTVVGQRLRELEPA